MSRTFALEVKVTKDGDLLKTINEPVNCNDRGDVKSLLNALQKTKENSNIFLTTLVEADKEAPIDKGGRVISHSKRKFDEKEGSEIEIFCPIFITLF